MSTHRSLSAVIPTRNRPADLCRAVASVFVQTQLPDELIVVDQSPGSESRTAVEALFANRSDVRLVYIHDPLVAGLVAAKQLAADRSVCDIVCFLEDDIILEPEFIQEILRGFHDDAHVMGCCGIITNQHGQSAPYVFMHGLFFRGILRDPRAKLFMRGAADGDAMTQCDVLWGGLSAWKREVFESVRFDTRNGFHMLEDIEFSTRVVRHFGHCLYVNRKARLEHHFSPVNRDAHGARQRRKLNEAITFYKKRRTWDGALLGIGLVLVWWLAEAAAQSVRNVSIGPVRGYLLGLADGWRREPLAAD